MTASITEARLRFEFAPPWRALRWDAKAPDDAPPYLYRDGIEKLKGDLTVLENGIAKPRSESTKAVDIVASPGDDGLLLLIEVKDFRSVVGPGGARPGSINSHGRWEEIPLEVALKVRDTLAALVGIAHLDQPQELAQWFRRAVTGEIVVVAVVAQDLPGAGRKKDIHQTRVREMAKNLQRRLAWLSDAKRCVLTVDPLAPLPPSLHGVSVTSVP